jgi:hypothetical protein
MTYQTIGIALIATVFFIIRYLNRTDVPKIKNLPEIPGVPIFGNLLQFGSSHAKVAASYVQKYGPVFQVRFGNRVSKLHVNSDQNVNARTADCLRQLLRIRKASVDHKSVCTDISSNSTYFP